MEMERKRVGVGLGGASTHPITSLGGSESKAPRAVPVSHSMWLCAARSPQLAARSPHPLRQRHAGGWGRLLKAGLCSVATGKTHEEEDSRQTLIREKEDQVKSLALHGEEA